jgi:hypothetical protein
VTEQQLPLFANISGARAASAASEAAPPEAPGAAPASAVDDRQLDLFADRAVLARELDAAITGGRFEAVAALRARVEEDFGPDAARSLVPLARFDGVAWDPPEAPLSVWADVDRLLAGHPRLREQVRTGVFGRLLQSQPSARLLAARPECLPALARALRERPGRPPEEGRREARALVRDALLAGRPLEAFDFRDDPAVADLLAEDRDPRWLACLGRIRRLWPSTPPRGAEREGLGEVAGGAEEADHPALAFWGCLRLAESPDCPDDLRQQARRRMKQLDPELHALFMRQAPHGISIH